MRRCLILLLLLIVPLICRGDGWFYGVAAAPATLTEEFFWNGDYPSHTDYAQITNGSTTLQGTLSGASVVAGGTDPNPASSDGANCLKLTAWNHYLRFAVTAGDIFSSSVGSMKMLLYLPDAPASQNAICTASNGSNTFRVSVGADRTINLFISNGTTTASVVSTDTITLDTWTNVEVRWDATENTLGVKIGAGSWKDDSEALDAFTSEPTYIYLGGTGTIQDTCPSYLDAFQAWTTYDES